MRINLEKFKEHFGLSREHIQRSISRTTTPPIVDGNLLPNGDTPVEDSLSRVNTDEIEEEILRQIRDDGILDDINIDNIDDSQEEQIGARIAEAYQKRQAEVTAEERVRLEEERLESLRAIKELLKQDLREERKKEREELQQLRVRERELLQIKNSKRQEKAKRRQEWAKSPREQVLAEIYESIYTPLSIENFEIRLMSLLPDADESFIVRCTLNRVSLLDPLRYKALSYCWGDPDVTERISLDGVSIGATTNLVAALRQFRRQGVETLWVDALCINQGDREERALQVQRMKDIYSHAMEVIVWVGSEDEYSEAALNAMESLAYNSFDSDFHKATAFTACERFFQRPYWRRVWIIQEIAVATKVREHCGARSTSWSNINKGLRSTDLVDFERFRKSIHEGQLGTLLKALYDTKSSLATDPGDRIYALLGLTIDGSEIIRFPNYKQPIRTVLTQMTKSIYMRTRRLDFMALRYPKRIHETRLPSWVPNWTDLAYAMSPWQVQLLHTPSLSYPGIYKDSKDFTIYGEVLAVSGWVRAIIEDLLTPLDPDKIETAERALPESQPSNSGSRDMEIFRGVFLNDMLQDIQPRMIGWLQANDEFLANGPSLDSYFSPMTLPINEDFYYYTWFIDETIKKTGQPWDNFHTRDSSIHELPNKEFSRERFEVIEEILKLGMRLFSTESGAVGIVHGGAAKGDKICCLKECEAPIVLRECDDGGGWIVVGQVQFGGGHYYEDESAKFDDKGKHITQVFELR